MHPSSKNNPLQKPSPYAKKVLLELESLHATIQGPSAHLLYLHLLRQACFKMHAERSKLMVNGMRSEAETLAEIEESLENTHTAALTPVHSVPPEFLQAIGPEKLMGRPDRQWELALAAEAIKIHWPFWKLETTIELRSLNGWQESLQSTLWPHGVILWTENAQTRTQTSVTPTWTGSWTLILDPKTQPQSLKIESVIGWHAGSELLWTRIY